MELIKNLSLVPRGLRYKLLLAFCLMSVIPLLVAAYLVRDYIFPPTKDMLTITWVLFFTVIISLLGMVLAKQIIEPVIAMSLQAKRVAEGELDKVTVSAEDEIGDIGDSINEITKRIKSNMKELKTYGEKARVINTEIHKKLLALSSVMQIGEHISSADNIDDVLAVIVEKTVQVVEKGYGLLLLARPDEPGVFLPRAASNVRNERLRFIEVKSGVGLLGGVIKNRTSLQLDADTPRDAETEAFMQTYDIKNVVAFPVVSQNENVGVFMVGSDDEGHRYNEDEVEIISLFSKQISIAYESHILAKKARELEIKDELTDLYNQKYIRMRLEEEIKRGMMYQRPCSFIIFNMDNFAEFRDKNGELATEKALKKIAAVLKENVTPIGRAARLSGDEFALLLPEINKKEAYKIAEDIRKKVERLDTGVKGSMRVSLSGGVSENPIDGGSADELMSRASESVDEAKKRGKNLVI